MGFAAVMVLADDPFSSAETALDACLYSVGRDLAEEKVIIGAITAPCFLPRLASYDVRLVVAIPEDEISEGMEIFPDE